MKGKLIVAGAVAGLVGLAACSDSPTGTGSTGSGNLSDADAAALAVALDGTSVQMVDDEVGGIAGSPSVTASADVVPRGSAGLVTTSLTYTRIRTCPVSGQTTLAGTMDRQRDTSTGTLTVSLEATRTPDGCTYEIPSGTISVTGNPGISVVADRKRVNGVPTGPQTTTHQGAFTWVKSAGASGSCQVDITSVLDPDAGTRTVTGTFCGRQIDRAVSWQLATGGGA